MNVLLATDGSKYGQWGLNWVATLPLVVPPRVTALHVLDSAAFRLPFRTKLEIQRVEVRSARTLRKATQQLASLKLKGTARKELGAVAPVILKHAPKRDGLLVVGSQGLNALDRFTLGSVSTKLIHHATCPVLVVKDEVAPLRRITLATDGSSASAKALEFVLTRFQQDRPTGKGGRVPIHVSVIHVMPSIKFPKLKEAGRRLVEPSVRKLIKAGFTAKPVYQLGNPAEEIMKVAAKHHADLIVMGPKGWAPSTGFLSGVFQHGSCSTRTVPCSSFDHSARSTGESWTDFLGYLVG